MKPGDLILFAWPSPWSKVDDPLDWENAKIGLVVGIAPVAGHVTFGGDELLVMHEGQRWSVPTAWCKRVDPVV